VNQGEVGIVRHWRRIDAHEGDQPPGLKQFWATPNAKVMALTTRQTWPAWGAQHMSSKTTFRVVLS